MLGELNAELSENFPLELYQLIPVGVILCSNLYFFFFALVHFPKAFPFYAALVICLSSLQRQNFHDFHNTSVTVERQLRYK